MRVVSTHSMIVTGLVVEIAVIHDVLRDRGQFGRGTLGLAEEYVSGLLYFCCGRDEVYSDGLKIMDCPTFDAIVKAINISLLHSHFVHGKRLKV